MFDSLAFDPDLRDRDHVTLFDLLISFRCELSSIREILPNLVDDHVKHAFDHVRLSRKLPCANTITSVFDWNFLAQTRSSCDPAFALLAIFVGTFGLALVAELTSRRFDRARFVIFGGPMPAIRAEMPGIFAWSTSISCFHVGGPPSVICADLLSTSERNF